MFVGKDVRAREENCKKWCDQKLNVCIFVSQSSAQLLAHGGEEGRKKEEKKREGGREGQREG